MPYATHASLDVPVDQILTHLRLDAKHPCPFADHLLLPGIAWLFGTPPPATGARAGATTPLPAPDAEAAAHETHPGRRRR